MFDKMMINYLHLFLLLAVLAGCCGCGGSNEKSYRIVTPAECVVVVTNGPHLSYTIPSNALQSEVGTRSLYSKSLLYHEGTNQVGMRKWWKNGQLSEETPMLGGVPHGITKYLREDGQLLSESPYNSGVLHGVSRGWYSNGALFKETPYNNGRKHGLARELDRDGKPIEEIYYFDDQKHGVARFWKNKAGFQGLKVPMGDGTWLWFYVNGKKVSEGDYIQACATNPTLPKLERL